MKFFAVFCIFAIIAAAQAYPLDDEEQPAPQPEASRRVVRQFGGNGQFNQFAQGGQAQQNNQGFGNTQGNRFQHGGSAQQNNYSGGNSQYNSFDKGGSAIQNNGK